MGQLNSTDNSQKARHNALKSLYGMNSSQLQNLRIQLLKNRKNHLVNNNAVRDTLLNNSIMQRQFINSILKEQFKLKNKINNKKYDELNQFLNTLNIDIDEYEAKTELYTNQGSVNFYEQQQDRQNFDNDYEVRQKNYNSIQKHPTSMSFMTKNDFDEQETLLESEFEQKERLRRQKFRDQQKKRKEEYMKELKKFKSSVDPYKLLKVSKNYTERELKLAYKKLVLRTHPDRPGGSNEKFQIVTKAYMTLLEELKMKKSDKQYMDLKKGASDYMENQKRYQKHNTKFDKDNFNLNVFNKIYDENKLYSPEDDGYKDWIENTAYETEDIKKNKLFSKKFNLNVFNSVFEEETDDTITDMVQYEEPQAMNSGANNCVVLGQDAISNFSSANSTDYCDYKQAYTTSRLVNPKTAKREHYRDIKHIKSARSNIQDYTPEELERLEHQKYLEEQKEEERKQRLGRNDEAHFENYARVHNMMLGYKD